jgi:peptidoglycan/xylan/chitin deacetylase (PgdA/CDA1 family)
MRAKLLPLIAALALASPACAKDAQVALTFDDLPALNLVDNQVFVDDLTARLIAGLKRHDFPATGFVVEGKLDDLVRDRQIADLQAWLDAGFDLGNHTFSHDSPNQLGAKAYIADIAKGDVEIRALLAARHRKPRWFRHPYLETGATPAIRKAIDDWLAANHYRIAPVSLVPSDYTFAEPYDVAIARKDTVHARYLRRSWLAYLQRSILWYREASHALFGRDVRYVMLLHATRLNADTIDDIAAVLKRDHLKVVSLDHAMKDPAYRIPDRYAGKDGIDWMERWSRALGKSLPWDDFREPPARIQAEYTRVDKDADEGKLPTDETAPPAPEEPAEAPAPSLSPTPAVH